MDVLSLSITATVGIFSTEETECSYSRRRQCELIIMVMDKECERSGQRLKGP
jgi:hypothetical protein